MKIAVVHDWLVTYAGAERVLEQILKLYPEADLFSIVDFLPQEQRGFILNKVVKVSFIQNLPFSKNKYRLYLPLMPLAIEQFDLSAYDLIISSSHAVAKGVITGPSQLHISYVHSPIRYAWDLQYQYLRESNLNKGIKGWLVKYLLHRIRLWDVASANRVDVFIANSDFIRRRIKKVYRRDAQVIYPPVAVNEFTLQVQKQGFYLTASRMVPYKKIDLIVEAFTLMPDKKLRVIGEGPDFEKIKKVAEGYSNIELLGYQSFSLLKTQMKQAKAFVFAAEEDFGIVPVEAQACGTPVIAFKKGGALETVVENKTGIFFDKQEVESVIDAINRFEISGFNPANVRQHALRFSTENFIDAFKIIVEDEVMKFKNN